MSCFVISFKTSLSLLSSHLHFAKNKHRLEARVKCIFRYVLFRCSQRNIWNWYYAPPLFQVICLQKLRSKSSPGFQPKGFVTLSLTVKSPVSLSGLEALSEKKTVACCWIWGVKFLVVLLGFHVYKHLLGRKTEGSKEEKARFWQCRRHWARVKPHGIPSENTFFLWGWSDSGTGCPEAVESLLVETLKTYLDIVLSILLWKGAVRWGVLQEKSRYKGLRTIPASSILGFWNLPLAPGAARILQMPLHIERDGATQHPLREIYQWVSFPSCVETSFLWNTQHTDWTLSELVSECTNVKAGRDEGNRAGLKALLWVIVSCSDQWKQREASPCLELSGQPLHLWRLKLLREAAEVILE